MKLIWYLITVLVLTIAVNLIFVVAPAYVFASLLTDNTLYFWILFIWFILLIFSIFTIIKKHL